MSPREVSRERGTTFLRIYGIWFTGTRDKRYEIVRNPQGGSALIPGIPHEGVLYELKEGRTRVSMISFGSHSQTLI
jgi:hypothetical protein